MRNILLFFVVALVANFCVTEQAFATGSGKAGGKKKDRVEIKNVNPSGGRAITVWVLPVDGELPETVGEARKLKPRKNVQAGKTESFKVKPGEYVVVAADTQAYKSAPDSTPIDETVVAAEVVEVNGDTVKLETETEGEAPTYVPGLYFPAD